MNVTAIKLTAENLKNLDTEFIERSIIRSGISRVDLQKEGDVVGNYLVMVLEGPIILSADEVFKTYNISKRFKGVPNGFELTPKVTIPEHTYH